MLIDLDGTAEVQIMRGINHPSVVKLHSFFESTEYYFLVLERKWGSDHRVYAC